MTRVKKILTIGIIIIIALALSFLFGSIYKSREMTPEISSTLIKNKIVSAKELTTLKYHYTNMGQFENQNTFYGYKVPFTSKKFIVSYDGTIHAGIDLDKLNVSVSDKKIDIKIPKAEILSHEIDENSLKVFDERESIFNRIDIEDYNNFSKDQKKEVENKAVQNGLLEEAQDEAEKAIYSLLSTDTVLKDYEINFGIDESL
ncbi:DUF4230 domain-containing protein [Peptoniphilus sp. MSJ-1]|uniref:DUF4230 domain-containing protein n=1 Tax=Peptoniphilus ovalis TaxID=2841503 RepID=A0ABS6FED6_9FIRM|nr:DUF4230 domain-containing protein [Peptoniphilus ovalis]MBU5668542.1 DUF4230 domain-containing protein [Peptoniphilus ovalis]